jgi:hypothetical protein
MNLCLLWRWDEPESFADETAEHCDCACAQWPAISEQQVAPAEIDFTVLHRQASDALDNLRRSQQLRAPTSPVVF